jgi:hypothetical protein
MAEVVIRLQNPSEDDPHPIRLPAGTGLHSARRRAWEWFGLEIASGEIMSSLDEIVTSEVLDAGEYRIIGAFRIPRTRGMLGDYLISVDSTTLKY